MSTPPSKADDVSKLISRLKRAGMARKFAVALAIMAIASGVATFWAMTSSGPSAQNTSVILNLLYLDVVLLLILAALIIRRIIRMRMQHSKGNTGSKLHTKLVLFFSLFAVTPAILVAIFASLYLNLGMQSWFNERVSTALSSTQTITEAYRDEHVRSIQIDALSLANFLNRNAARLSRSRFALERELNKLALDHNLAEAAIIDGQRRVIAQTALTLSLAFENVSEEIYEKANQNDVVITFEPQNDRARAVVRLDRYIDAYLFIGRFIPPDISGSIETVENAYKQYSELEKKREGIHISFVMIFMVITLMLLLAATWLGMNFANQIVSPLVELMHASERVRKGDLGVRVQQEHGSDEIGLLGRAFNRMTEQLQTQRESLVEANRELAERHRFTETVLDGVSAGVIGLDVDGNIHLPNRFSSLFLQKGIFELIGQKLTNIMPELSDMLDVVKENPKRTVQEEIKILRNDQLRTINAALTAEWIDQDLIGYVLTFDDITELQSAQRSAAWANVARRIAHEIKNPLTPIQLSAERLKRKYLKDIQNDPDTFSLCTDTIIRQVDDLRSMVDEFSSFARMPRPKLKVEKLTDICNEVVFLEKNRTDIIEYNLAIENNDEKLLCDRQQITRLLTNLLKNAAEGIFTKHNLDPEDSDLSQITDKLGQIEMRALSSEHALILQISDNGIGFPADDRDKLTDPYVTTRRKGTGLGLAISKKIMEEHQGSLILKDNENGGAIVELTFPHVDASLITNNEQEQNPMKMATRVITDGA